MTDIQGSTELVLVQRAIVKWEASTYVTFKSMKNNTIK